MKNLSKCQLSGFVGVLFVFLTIILPLYKLPLFGGVTALDLQIYKGLISDVVLYYFFVTADIVSLCLVGVLVLMVLVGLWASIMPNKSVFILLGLANILLFVVLLCNFQWVLDDLEMVVGLGVGAFCPLLSGFIFFVSASCIKSGTHKAD